MLQFSAGSEFRLMSRQAITRTCFGLGFLIALGSACPADERTEEYIRKIRTAQTSLDDGDAAAAKEALDSTDETQRGFEYEYLHARLALAKDGTAAPDLIRTVAKPAVESRYGVLNPANRQLVFICRDGGLRIHDLMLMDDEPRVEKHPGDSAIWTGTFSNDGKTFFSGHQNGEVLVWDAVSWKIRQTVSLGEEWPVRELAATPDGSAFVGESKEGLELWSLTEEQPKKVAKIGDRYNFGEGLAISPIGNMIATGGMFDIILHDAKTGDELQSLRHASYTMGLEFSPDGKRIASAPRGNVNKFLAVFDIAQTSRMFNIGPLGNYIAGLAFTPDGRRIAATGCEKHVRLFDAATGETVLSLKREECSAKPSFTHDGQLFGWNEPAGFLYIVPGKP